MSKEKYIRGIYMGEIKREEGIGIIIPSFKPQKYIEKCLDSLNKQTLDKEKFKVYIILNGPKEYFWDYLSRTLKTMDINIELVYIQECGVSKARNTGIMLNEFEYILFLDDDDFLSSNFLQDIFNYRKLDSIVFSNTISIDFQGNEKRDYLSNDFLNNYTKKNLGLLASRKQLSNSCGKLIPMDIVQKIRYKEDIFIGEDSLFMAMLSKNFKKTIYSNLSIIYYRTVRENSISRSNLTIKKIKNDIILAKYYLILLLKGYNFLFVITRVLATVKRNIKKYEGIF